MLPAGHPDCDDKTGELDETQRVVGPPTTASNRRNSSAYGQDGRAIAPSPLSALFLARERRGGSSGSGASFWPHCRCLQGERERPRRDVCGGAGCAAKRVFWPEMRRPCRTVGVGGKQATSNDDSAVEHAAMRLGLARVARNFARQTVPRTPSNDGTATAVSQDERQLLARSGPNREPNPNEGVGKLKCEVLVGCLPLQWQTANVG